MSKRVIGLQALLFVIEIGFGQAPFKTGVNFPMYLPNLKTIDQYLQLVSESGGKCIRQMTWADVHWRQVEPADNSWDFVRSDSAFLNPFGLMPIGTLYSMMGNDQVGMQTPWLACTNPFNCFWDPAGDSIFSKDYVFTSINRYKHVTKYWEVANEIESALPPPGLPNILSKKEFLRYNYLWIKQADPDAQVLLPGLVGTCCTFPISKSFDWLRNMLHAGTGGFFDIMNYHDYNAWWTLPAHYDSVRHILAQYGLSKPIWITETAVSSFNTSPITPSYSSANEQAADVWRRLCLLWGKGAEVVLWHSGWSSNDLNAWGEFGLISNSGMKKKSFHSYRLLNNKLANFSSVKILSQGAVTDNNNSGGNGVWVVRFVVDGSPKWVLWSPDNQPYTLHGLGSPFLRMTEVVPTRLTHGGDSAIFETKVVALSGSAYTFNALPQLPIVVEETNATSAEDLDRSARLTFDVYPDPAQNFMVVHSHTELQGADIYVSNFLGQKICILHRVSGRQFHVALDRFAKGIYWLIIEDRGRLLSKKFAIQ